MVWYGKLVQKNIGLGRMWGL